jgi:hypothetical protein
MKVVIGGRSLTLCFLTLLEWFLKGAERRGAVRAPQARMAGVIIVVTFIFNRLIVVERRRNFGKNFEVNWKLK